jgi:hypothetical protein
MRLRKFYYRFVTVPYIGIKNLVSKSKCIDLCRFFVTEIEPWRRYQVYPNAKRIYWDPLQNDPSK